MADWTGWFHSVHNLKIQLAAFVLDQIWRQREEEQKKPMATMGAESKA